MKDSGAVAAVTIFNLLTDTINIQCPRIFDVEKKITFTLLELSPNITKHIQMGKISDFLPNP